MPVGKRKKRVRLSFIGGRRSSLLPAVSKKQKANNQRNESSENENEGSTVSVINNILNEKNSLSSTLSSTDTNDGNISMKATDVVKCSDTAEVNVVPTKLSLSKIKDENIAVSATDLNTGEANSLSRTSSISSSSKLTNENETVESTQIIKTLEADENRSEISKAVDSTTDNTSACRSKRKSKRNLRRLTVEELKLKSEKLSEVSSQHSVNMEKVLTEIDKWRHLLLNPPVVDEAKLNMFEKDDKGDFYFEKEMEEIQSTHDEIVYNAEQCSILDRKLRLIKEVVNADLEKQRKEVQFNSTDVVNIAETPRHLIRKMLNPKMF